MEVNINQSIEEKQAQKKVGIKKYLIIGGVLVIVIVAGIFVWKKQSAEKSSSKEVPADLIGQYKQDLNDLQKKAETSGSKEDLQAYAIAQYATGNAMGAIETYTEQIKKDPNSIVAHGGLANALRDQKNFDGAIEQYKKVIEISPTDISAYVNLASVYQYQLKQTDKAIEIYKQAIEKNPKSADLYVLIGLAYEQSSDNGSARTNYEKALEIDENNVAAKAGLERLVQ
ncbi:MAG: hypothetical protein US25_C0063G0004 [Candidatus Moranbacteria bacterium GW2011_GWE1_36_7]|nr:MAG: hypothetical protein UR99_C0027G0005 [Candidatus Moranbacteria bacterium GW2011_GWD2_36_12]KKQ06026.1 MAG: hypothetical protein US16_C0027G0004 [Candidatus Moranbacteria bacterium GW2011_GWE2_36_40]KKQ12041.1 MAG: hypothetical protein US25_C0063G0004 [Candidatus Moranbacteria bacterium GW2011_GWE1_36_7]